MNIKLTHAWFIVYVILISLITKKFQLLLYILFALIFILFNFFIRKKINSLENLAYIIIAFVPFPYLLSIFLIHLPFSVFGILLEKRDFIKNYILGFAVSLIPTILIYTASNYLNLRLNFLIILLFFYLPAIFAIILVIKKKISFDFSVDFKDYLVILAVLLSTVFVGINIVNDYSLFISNGTYLYTKFELIVKSINSYGTFPIYDPATSQGEPPFLFESPLVFSHLAFVSILLKFIPIIVFYNAFSFFILFLSTLSLSVLIKSVLNKFFEKESSNRIVNTIVIITGSLLIGLHFYFVQLLESFKQFFAFPINYLIFAFILEKPQKFKEIMFILYMIILTFVIHTPHGVGIVLISFSMSLLIFINLYASKEIYNIKNWLSKNKFKVFAATLILSLIPSFYILPTFLFKDFLEDQSKINWETFGSTSISYLTEFVKSSNLLSLKYPDVDRNDDKKFGPLISIFGLSSSVIVLVLFYKSKSLINFRMFFGAYFLHFLISSIIINLPMIGSLEYSYRTVSTYFLILLVTSICTFILLIKQKYIRFFLIILFFVGLIHMLPYAKKNIENIHREEFISGKWFKEEINFVKNLPKDGRMVTYGLFANAIDPGMASLTDKYFSRFHLTELARSRSIYAKIHSEHSFGQTDTLLSMSGTELANYLRLGGYKYVFVDLRHPIGAFVAKNLYPNFSYTIHQNQALVLFVVNNTNYAEKVSVLKDVNENVYKERDGYKYVALSKHYKFDTNILYSKDVIEPERLNFKRINPTEVEIYGNFSYNDWVTFKESYFSRWKAYMNGKDIPVLASNNNLILVKTTRGDTINLKYKILPIERVSGVLSLISALIFLLILLFL